eukprot:sb/3475173/
MFKFFVLFLVAGLVAAAPIDEEKVAAEGISLSALTAELGTEAEAAPAVLEEGATEAEVGISEKYDLIQTVLNKIFGLYGVVLSGIYDSIQIRRICMESYIRHHTESDSVWCRLSVCMVSFRIVQVSVCM